jgi:FixJ family two-component response regulator
VNEQKVIAVTDDDPAIRTALHRLLTSSGYSTELYASADELLNAAATSKADCLIIDINLGTTTGVELTRQLSALGYRFPVIFMTAHDSNVLRAQALRFGCVAYLYKPFPSQQLLNAIDRALSQENPS